MKLSIVPWTDILDSQFTIVSLFLCAVCVSLIKYYKMVIILLIDSKEREIIATAIDNMVLKYMWAAYRGRDFIVHLLSWAN